MVRRFGQMVTDHSRANSEFLEIASKEDFTPPKQMDKNDQAIYDKLSNLNDPDFDRAYISQK